MTSLTFADPGVRKHYRLIQKLAVDLQLIRTGTGPTPEQLAEAPIIEAWRLGVRAEPALIGFVSRHPFVSGNAVTSSLYVLDPELGYARTLSRFYRLGKEIR